MKNMSFIISSKILYKKLRAIDPETIGVVRHKDGILTILYGSDDENEIKIEVQTSNDDVDKYFQCLQIGGRWDWVYDLVRVVPEQPIVLTIGENSIRISFDY